MIVLVIPFVLALTGCQSQEDIKYYDPSNVSRLTTGSDIAAYRSALTLDWLSDEETRQRDVVHAFATNFELPSSKIVSSECMSYPRPTTGKVSRLMLEMFKSVEGENTHLITEFVNHLARLKLLVEGHQFEMEPNLKTLVETPEVMQGEPHVTLPRVVALVWFIISDTAASKHDGWCNVAKVNKYLTVTKPVNVARHMRNLDLVMARIRFIIEEFIHHVNPHNLQNAKQTKVSDSVKKSAKTETRGKVSKSQPGNQAMRMPRSGKDENGSSASHVAPEEPQPHLDDVAAENLQKNDSSLQQTGQVNDGSNTVGSVPPRTIGLRRQKLQEGSPQPRPTNGTVNLRTPAIMNRNTAAATVKSCHFVVLGLLLLTVYLLSC